jgi:Ser/Thr protein kinase RdoA (MazF antagonist)
MSNNPVKTRPYDNLTPDVILDAIESMGFAVDGSQFPLNSYENRVYQIGLNEGDDLIAKFYRPLRWTDEAILEEHQFSHELAEQEIPVIAPLNIDGRSLFIFEGYRFALFPKRGGRSPELDNEEHLEWLGRFMGRLHAVGRTARFQHRPTLTVKRLGYDSYHYLSENHFIPDYLQHNYCLVVEEILQKVSNRFEACEASNIRIHGDCHPGNILWTPKGPHFVDLDDTMMGPAIQDLWMLLSGDQEQMEKQFKVIMEGYSMFSSFDSAELSLIEPLRALRQLHYSAWLARRWDDPAFPLHFPWFNTPRYWEDHLNDLRQQNMLLDENIIEYC